MRRRRIGLERSDRLVIRSHQERAAIALNSALFLLLCANAVYFVLSGSASKAMDSCAWLALLALLQVETRFGRHLHSVSRRRALRAARLFAAAGVVAATIGYVFEDNALDAANSVLWMLVVAMLEVQLRFPALAQRRGRILGALAVVLYAGLGVLVALWAAQGLWFDAYDAALWLVAFVTIELAVVGGEARAAAIAH